MRAVLCKREKLELSVNGPKISDSESPPPGPMGGEPF